MDTNAQIEQLKQQIEALSAKVNLNNFSTSRDHNKYERFNTRLKIPSYDTPPSVCEVGELIEDGGVLKICSATNTWTIVGSQV